MVQAIRVHKTGGPEVMVLEEVALPPPGPGMVTVANRAIGLNFIDTYFRNGLYPAPLPSGLGMEGAGVVEAVGAGVDLAVGDRVAYCSAGIGAYAQAAAAIEFTKEYTQQRMVFGQPVAHFQNTKFELAACQAEVDAAQVGGHQRHAGLVGAMDLARSNSCDDISYCVESYRPIALGIHNRATDVIDRSAVALGAAHQHVDLLLAQLPRRRAVTRTSV